MNQVLAENIVSLRKKQGMSQECAELVHSNTGDGSLC